MEFNSNSLKVKLKIIKNNNLEIPNDINPFDLALNMIKHIGSPDPELRDDLIYIIMANWIIDGVFIDEQLRQILKITLDDNHLFHHIGAEGDDSVFTRSFSVLLIPPILFSNEKSNFLSKDEIKETYKKVINYFIEEKDLRGYVENKGWAHSAAHTADVLDELAKCSYIEHKELGEILDLIKLKISINHYVYINEEDERMVTAVVNVLRRNILTETELVNWIKGFGKIEKINSYPEDSNLNINVKGFLRSLYFRLLDQQEFETITSTLKETLNEMNKYKDL